MVMVHLVAKQLFDGVHHPLATGDHAVDVIAGMVPQGQVGPATGRVLDLHRMRLQHTVGPAGVLQQARLVGVQEMLDEQIAVAVKGRVLSVG